MAAGTTKITSCRPLSHPPLRTGGLPATHLGSPGFPGYTSAMARIEAFLAVARAPFLLLPVTLIASGTMAARLDGEVSYIRALIALVGLIALHMAVNIFNEISDMKRGIDLETQKTPFSGGSGALPSGALKLSSAMVFGLVCTLIGAGVGVYFLLLIGREMLIIMIVGALCVLGYTDLLARIGIGEIAAGAGLGGLPVLGAALIQGHGISSASIAAAIPASLLTFDLLLLNEFPDEKADRKGGRRNLLLLFGRKSAGRIYVLAGIGVPVSLGISVLMGFLPTIALSAVLPSLFFLRPAVAVIRNPESDPPIPALAANVSWNLVTNTMIALALFVERMPW